MQRIWGLLLALLPSVMKVRLLRAMGHDVHPTAYIGASYLGVARIVMGPHTHIGHGNAFTNLAELHMDEGSRIDRWNRFSSGCAYKGALRIGKRSAITLRHYLDICDEFTIGSDTIIAGHRSTFFTHSKGLMQVDYTKPIVIGNWCYVGSNVCFAPGVVIGEGVFVGLGAVVVGDHRGDSYCLLGGNPACVKKKYSREAAYFQQGALWHDNMPKDAGA